MARGHTLGTHTWSHPFYLRRASIEKAREEIERGFSAVTLAAGQPIAPFFRFPGLADSNPMMAHLQSRGIAAFTVDVVSNDSYIGDARRLTEGVISRTIARDGGILLFHDIKHSTAKALPEILSQLKARGFKVVHMRAKSTYTPVADYDEQLKAALAKLEAQSGKAKPALVPITAAVAPEVAAITDAVEAVAASSPPVTALAPAARPRGPAETPRARVVTTSVSSEEAVVRPAKPRRAQKLKRKHVHSDEPQRFYD
jgi:hypothetical protein